MVVILYCFQKVELYWGERWSMKVSYQFRFRFVSADDYIGSFCLCIFLQLLFGTIVILIVIYQYIYCSKLSNICCWWLFFNWRSLGSNVGNLLWFISSSFCIKTCMGCCCSVIGGLGTLFFVGVWWYNNIPLAILVIPLPFYHHFLVLYCINILFFNHCIATIVTYFSKLQ